MDEPGMVEPRPFKVVAARSVAERSTCLSAVGARNPIQQPSHDQAHSTTFRDSAYLLCVGWSK
jgi:hypothetical protein